MNATEQAGLTPRAAGLLLAKAAGLFLAVMFGLYGVSYAREDMPRRARNGPQIVASLPVVDVAPEDLDPRVPLASLPVVDEPASPPSP